MNVKKLLFAVGASTLLASVQAQAFPFQESDAGTIGSEVTAGQLLEGRYIVTLSPQTPDLLGLTSLQESVTSLLTAVGGGDIIHLYEHAMTGAAVSLTPAQASLLQSMPGVLAIEPDTVVRATAVQADATWGLDRSDQPYLPLNNQYSYPDSAGDGVTVYVIDTGLRASHEDFTGRVAEGRNFVSGVSLLGLGGLLFSADPGDTSDCNGHGTHVSSTAVGTEYGIAKQARVAPVRVLDCAGTGSNADVIAGVDWVAANHQSPAVANMSLGGGNSDALDTAVRGAIEDGVTFVVAAGNDDTDACAGSPNRVDEAVTVGSTTREDQRSSFSNYGTCVDVFAPGSDITAAWYQSDTQTNTISGTSMASPHVAGAAALILNAHPTLQPEEVFNQLLESATPSVLSGIGAGSPNSLLRTAQ
ncbi:MAG: S8 family peptidase [Marinobacter sp.]|uniref:S8 family peptidase n=1 Tax=Marinobacter sp. TaxID=50741 RepID=UPI00299EAD89|nr:S8 family peptidase [Marinobacter sp.]MDX1756172.1 S8 family peptidase [Marinobacter sp.]